MYLWRRSVDETWWSKNGDKLNGLAGDLLAIIEQSNRKRLHLEVASKSETELERVAAQFGRRVEKLSRDWLRRSRHHKTKPLKMGDKTADHSGERSFWNRRTCNDGNVAITRKVDTQLDSSPVDRRPRNRHWNSRAGGKMSRRYRVIGIGDDAIAISTARENARLNKIRRVQFRLADIRQIKPPHGTGVVTANLFSELLIEVLPKLGYCAG